MIFRTFTRDREIGANSYLIDFDHTRVVLDSGMHPKAEGLDAVPDWKPIEDMSIDAMLVSHAHLDHVGTLPVFQRHHPEAPVYLTEPCGMLADALLHNSVNVMSSKREEHGIHEYPLFTHQEQEDRFGSWNFASFNRPVQIGDNGVSAQFFDAGHNMGSAGIMIEDHETRVFYTGDVNFEDATIQRGALFPEEQVDVLIMETTRGFHARDPGYNRASEVERLGQVIAETIAGGGSVLIPVFAIGKTQELLMMLHLLKTAGAIPKAPISIGGLSTKMTTIYDRFAHRIRRQHAGFELLKQMDLQVSARRKRAEIQYYPGAIYALSSGMMTERTVSNEFAFKFLQNPKNAVCFVGYADPASPAYQIRTGQPGDMIELNSERPKVQLNSRVETFDFSGHADRESLCDYAKRLQPKKIVLVHGDLEAQEWFRERLSREMPNTEVIGPQPGVAIPLR